MNIQAVVTLTAIKLVELISEVADPVFENRHTCG